MLRASTILLSGLLLCAASPAPDKTAKIEGPEAIAALFKRLNVRYLAVPELKRPDLLHTPANKTLLYRETWGHGYRGRKYGDKIRSSYIAKVYVKWVNDIVGYGLFAAEDIKRRSFIGEYTGIVAPNTEVHDTSYAWGFSLKKHDDEPDNELMVDALKAGNEMRFVNHSYSPNVAQEWIAVDGAWHVVFLAKKTIKKDSQILVSYGENYWESRGITPIEL
jgi:SET domain-containing protein